MFTGFCFKSATQAGNQLSPDRLYQSLPVPEPEPMPEGF